MRLGWVALLLASCSVPVEDDGIDKDSSSGGSEWIDFPYDRSGGSEAGGSEMTGGVSSGGTGWWTPAGGHSSGGGSSSGGASGGVTAAGGHVEEPLDWAPVEKGCSEWRAYRVPEGECIKVRGNFYVESFNNGGECGVVMNNVAFVCSVYNTSFDDEDGLVRIFKTAPPAHHENPYVVERYLLDSEGDCPRDCDGKPWVIRQ